MKWYFPAWNGDHRLEPDAKNPAHTVLTIQRPTADESRLLDILGKGMLANGWIEDWKKVEGSRAIFKKKVLIKAPLEKVGPLFVWAFKPGPAVLTAVKYENGRVVTCAAGGPSELLAFSEKIAEEARKEPEKPKPDVAATVKRHTPCCPSCVPGSIEPAREVLLAFLTPDQHATWARDRFIYVEGSLTGAVYRLAHRHTKLAEEQGRICKDLDANLVVHFHDWTVPPEEEVLAAKLILEHHEPWLRNEATMLGYMGGSGPIFKNPFGDGMDGVPDASFTSGLGRVFSLGELR